MVKRLVGAGALLLVACGSDAPSTPVVYESVADTYVAGTRLAVEYWVHGSLSLPWRFVDTAFDQPCAVERFDDVTYCVPINKPSPTTTGFADDLCGSLAMVDDGAYAEGELITVSGAYGAPQGVYRVGAPLAFGLIYFSADACQGAGAVQGVEPPNARRALEPVPLSEFVRFDVRSRPAQGGFQVDAWEGEDGALLVGELRHGEEACSIFGDRCALQSRLGTSVPWFARAYADSGCANDAIYNISDQCSSGLLVAVDECGEVSLLGAVGVSISASTYQRSPAGDCEDWSLGLGENFISTPGCPQTVVPATARDAPQLHEQRTAQDGLELVRVSAGDIVVAMHFRLVDGPRCQLVRTSDAVTRCVPTAYVNAATGHDGVSGRYTTYNFCETGGVPTPDLSPGLFTFSAGKPCGFLTTVARDGDIPEVSKIERFVPHDGQVFDRGDSAGFPVCAELPREGFYVPVETIPDEFPTVDRAVR